MTSDVNKIHSDMLENISNDYQKTQGFPTYDLTRAFAITCLALYVKANQTAGYNLNLLKVKQSTAAIQ